MGSISGLTRGALFFFFLEDDRLRTLETLLVSLWLLDEAFA